MAEAKSEQKRAPKGVVIPHSHPGAVSPGGLADEGDSAPLDIERYMRERAAMVERALARAVSETDAAAGRLFEAMRYSLLAGGKRLRPVLALAACEGVGGPLEAAMGFACAIEMIHTYSLIPDALPFMDDDDLRRGRPTNHKIYGEGIATLAGDALLTDAFRVLAKSALGKSALESTNVPPAAMLATVAELAAAAGSAGMVAGQAIDVLGEGRTMTIEELEYLHRRKTGALFIAAVRGGARLGGATQAQLEALEAYARALGQGRRARQEHLSRPYRAGQVVAAGARSRAPRASRARRVRPSRRTVEGA